MSLTNLRLLLAVVAASYGAYELSLKHSIGLLGLLAAGFLLIGGFSENPERIAFRKVNDGDLKSASDLLLRVKKPERLPSERRAYFELASAMLAVHRGNNALAEDHLHVALKNRLRSPNDRAVALATLAQLLIARDAPIEARPLLKEARGLAGTAKARQVVDQVAASIETPEA